MAAERDTRPYCAKHDTYWSALKPCPQCAANPPAFVPPVVEKAADPLSAEDEKYALAEAEWLDGLTRQLIEAEGITTKALNAVAKLKSEALRNRRFAAECRNERLTLESREKLIEHDRQMAGLRRRSS